MKKSYQPVSLWGEEFVVSPTSTNKTLNKLRHPKSEGGEKDPAKKLKNLSLAEKLPLITQEVMRVLGKERDKIIVISSRQQLTSYIDRALAKGIIAVDTETNKSLDPLTCKLMGGCLYVPGEKRCYVPVNHRDPASKVRLPWQCTEQDIKEELSRIKDLRVITHNGKFDYQVLHCTCGVDIPIYWDSMIAARMLDENEHSAGLKQQYISKIDPDQTKYSIDSLFSQVDYEDVDPYIFAYYASMDPYMTFELAEWQKRKFEDPALGLDHLYKLFLETEMPIVSVSARMELRGICLDTNYAKRLSIKYHSLMDEVDAELSAELSKLKPQIDNWRLTPEANKKVNGWFLVSSEEEKPLLMKYKKEDLKALRNYLITTFPKKYRWAEDPYRGCLEKWNLSKSKAEQLESPIKLTSNNQLAILFYDVLKFKAVDPSNPRAVGRDTLDLLAKKTGNSLCQAMIKKREYKKLINTYIDKLPAIVSPRDDRLHGHFNQLDTDTGRFASKDPNLQNIPSGSKDIRLMFRAAPGYTMVGADFSQAEPRLLACYSQDAQMIEAYREKKDLYATVASAVYGNNYEDNLEFRADGTRDNEGAERRASCKSIILGIMYGRGAYSIAEQIHKTPQEAQHIIDQFYLGFPKVKEWIAKTQSFCHEKGYVEDLWGRRRRLPNIQLPPYVLLDTSEKESDQFNPLLESPRHPNAERQSLLKHYAELVKNIRGAADFAEIKEQASRSHIDIRSNIALIKEAERQSVNARVQGGSATITKRAMIAIDKDPEMHKLDFHMQLCIHDEVIGECPKANAEAVTKRLVELMLQAPKPECNIPFKCDGSSFDHWYENEYKNAIQEEYEKDQPKLEDFYKEHSEMPPETLLSIVDPSKACLSEAVPV